MRQGTNVAVGICVVFVLCGLSPRAMAEQAPPRARPAEITVALVSSTGTVGPEQRVELEVRLTNTGGRRIRLTLDCSCDRNRPDNRCEHFSLSVQRGSDQRATDQCNPGYRRRCRRCLPLEVTLVQGESTSFTWRLNVLELMGPGSGALELVLSYTFPDGGSTIRSTPILIQDGRN